MSQEINKKSLKSKVIKAIQKMPYKGVFSRLEENRYHKEEYRPLFTLTGVRYTKDTTNFNITTTDAGVNYGKAITKFLVVWDDNSKTIKKGDFVTINGDKYVVKDTGNQSEICLDMIIEEV